MKNTILYRRISANDFERMRIHCKIPNDQLPITPAAEITAKTTTDGNSNTVIEVVAKNLAECKGDLIHQNQLCCLDRYRRQRTKKHGLLNSKNGRKAVLKTSTPFKVKFI
jgi:hypothetical protein